MRLFDEAKEILELLQKASNSYYNEGVSIITDAEYDQKKDRLATLYNRVLFPKKSIDPSFVEDVEVYLNQIGAPIVAASEWEKASHCIPMTSLNKVNSQAEFETWANEIGDSSYVIFDKMDGGSIDLVYDNSNLIQAISRGNGVEGEDMLQNVLKMQNVRATIPGFTGNIYGEVFILRDDFEKLLVKSGRDYKNPRNTATGLQKTLTGENVEFLSIYYYDIAGTTFFTEEEKLQTIERFGLKTCFWKKVSIVEAIQVFNEYESKIRATLPYDIDGLVIRANSITIQQKHGMLGGNPKAKIAWKFKPMQKETILKDILWHIGNSRRVTPIAILEPTPMGGVTVRRCSLHNVEMFKTFKFKKGCAVLIERANDVIPYLLENHGGGTEDFVVPGVCPECGGKTEIQGKFLMCTNDDCSGLGTGNLERWVQVLDIDGLGPKIIQMLYENGLVKEPADFYKLTVNQVAGLERLGERSATKIVTNLRAKMAITLPEFIAGLNMPNFSKETATALMVAGYDIVKLFSATEEALIQVKGIGTKTASQIKAGLAAKATFMKNLFDVGITIKEPEKIKIDSNKFAGMSFCFTGAIQAIKPDGKRYTREDMLALVKANGGIAEDSVNKGLTYLVMVDPSSTSSKAQKARQLGITILSESDFFKML
ncbi:MAG: NAD-dependent DNA ligase LigA [Candidatus Nanoarchaeia archaeon]|jgi:DNA ligase (NAD+)|nr:NAD-dependent DNA ligase LigA [Candidatus Nanoarchaeia archaeon]